MVESMFEYCGVIFKKLMVKVKIKMIFVEEVKFDFDVLNMVVENVCVMDICDIDIEVK